MLISALRALHSGQAIPRQMFQMFAASTRSPYIKIPGPSPQNKETPKLPIPSPLHSPVSRRGCIRPRLWVCPGFEVGSELWCCCPPARCRALEAYHPLPPHPHRCSTGRICLTSPCGFCSFCTGPTSGSGCWSLASCSSWRRSSG